MLARRLSAFAVGAGLSLGAPAARADLAADVANLKAAWNRDGHVVELRPRLLERGGILPIMVPISMLDPRSGGCVTIALLGTTTTHFVLHQGSAKSAANQTGIFHASLAGALEISRCGIDRLDLMRLAVEMRSPRAVLQTLIVESERPPPEVAELLSHRDPGPLADLGGPGPRPTPAPLAQRLAALEGRLKREGGANISRQGLRSRADGSGESSLTLEPGCHELHLLSEASDAADAVTLEVSLDVTTDSDDALPFAPSESSDAAQKLCVGRAVRALLHFGGAGPNATVSLLSAEFALPRGLPDHWGQLTRARTAGTLRRHGLLLPGAPPFYESLGVQGVTALPVEVTPGTCYVATLVAIRGDVAALSLAVETGSSLSQNTVLPPASGTAIAFCARESSLAHFEVESKGFGLAWLFSAWEAGRLNPGEVGE